MSKVFQPKDVAFGEVHYGTKDTAAIAPQYQFIPYEFKFENDNANRNFWQKIIVKWFKYGLHKDSKLQPKRGIDKERAIRHIQCLLNCWLVPQKHKLAAGAFLLQQWFENIDYVDILIYG